MKPSMRVFHRTTQARAAVILTDGFRDGEGTYMTDKVWRGVWVSDRPLDANEGPSGDVLLELKIRSDVFAEYEWVEDEKIYRESLIPAAILNNYGRPTIATDD